MRVRNFFKLVGASTASWSQPLTTQPMPVAEEASRMKFTPRRDMPEQTYVCTHGVCLGKGQG